MQNHSLPSSAPSTGAVSLDDSVHVPVCDRVGRSHQNSIIAVVSHEFGAAHVPPLGCANEVHGDYMSCTLWLADAPPTQSQHVQALMTVYCHTPQTASCVMSLRM